MICFEVLYLVASVISFKVNPFFSKHALIPCILFPAYSELIGAL